MQHKLVLSAILILALILRLFGLNWDQDQHLHPDERFLTMVTDAMEWPTSISSYLNTPTSTLNPHNIGYNFYVYGTFPLILVKLVAASLGLDDYTHITLVGRAFSAFLDTSTVLLVFLITHRLFHSYRLGLLSAFLYTIYVLPIQLSHYFAVEPFLTFFLTLGFYLLLTLIQAPMPKFSPLLPLTLGATIGLAFAAKVTALLFLPILALGLLLRLRQTRHIRGTLYAAIFVSTTLLFTIRITYPYLFTNSHILDFTPNPQTLANFRELSNFVKPGTTFPPSVQWLRTPSLIYPLTNLVLWGLGLPLGLLAIVATFYILRRARRHPILFLLPVWILLLFLYQGVQFAMPTRYFYPIYPFLAIVSAHLLLAFAHPAHTTLHRVALALFLLLSSLWPASFMSIYTRPHSRIAASKWIYENIPPGSNISCEHWDDCLPLNLEGSPGNGSYRGVELPLYHPDSEEKWAEITAKLAQTDYIILSSNRLYGSIMTTPDIFPQTNQFYTRLFRGDLGFTKIVEFTSRPNLPFPFIRVCLTPPPILTTYGAIARMTEECPLPGLSFVDDYADEVFTVYDHPKVIIFKKSAPPPITL